jgi:hypothetical protein
VRRKDHDAVVKAFKSLYIVRGGHRRLLRTATSPCLQLCPRRLNVKAECRGGRQRWGPEGGTRVPKASKRRSDVRVSSRWRARVRALCKVHTGSCNDSLSVKAPLCAELFVLSMNDIQS